jgi:hypothetical protein
MGGMVEVDFKRACSFHTEDLRNSLTAKGNNVAMGAHRLRALEALDRVANQSQMMLRNLIMGMFSIQQIPTPLFLVRPHCFASIEQAITIRLESRVYVSSVLHAEHAERLKHEEGMWGAPPGRYGSRRLPYSDFGKAIDEVHMVQTG